MFIRRLNNLAITTVLLLAAAISGNVNAALVNFEIDGTVIIGDETFPNSFGLTAGDIITATGTIDDSLFGAGVNTIAFDDDISYTLSIDVNGTIFTDSDDSSLDGAVFIFEDGLLTNFDYQNTSFSSLGITFDDKGFMAGQWDTTATITAVPVPAAAWLFGSGLIGLVGLARRKAS
jgi:hypothetical protein